MDIILGLAVSQHLNFQNDYNEIHPHIRFQQDFFIGGAYYNSIENISPYAGVRLDHNSHGFELGVVGGYPELGIALPYVRYTYDLTDTLRVFVSPAGEMNNNEVNYSIVVGTEILAFN
jgi:hypothetical protein